MLHLKRPAVLLALVGAFATVGLLAAFPATAGVSGLNNGSFQTCDLTGWSTEVPAGGTAGVTGGGYDFNCTGFVSTGSAAVDADVFLRHDAFWATAGTKVSVYAYFSGDCGAGFDEGDVVLDGNEYHAPCDANWHLYQWTVGYTGYHYFEADVDNEFDTLFNSTLYVDVLKASGLSKV